MYSFAQFKVYTVHIDRKIRTTLLSSPCTCFFLSGNIYLEYIRKCILYSFSQFSVDLMLFFRENTDILSSIQFNVLYLLWFVRKYTLDIHGYFLFYLVQREPAVCRKNTLDICIHSLFYLVQREPAAGKIPWIYTDILSSIQFSVNLLFAGKIPWIYADILFSIQFRLNLLLEKYLG